MAKTVEAKVNMFGIKDIMSGVVIFQDISQSVQQVAAYMFRNNAHAIIVMDKGIPVGIITERDIASSIILAGKDPRSIRAGEIMSTPIVKLSGDNDILSARKFMMLNKIKKIPVEDQSQIVGMITQNDIVTNIF